MRAVSSLRPNHRLLWLTLFSLWLGALAPTVARAMASSRGEIPSWTQVCTQAGMRSVIAGDTVADPNPAGAIDKMLMEHCPACVVHGIDHAALPPTGSTLPVDTRLAHATPERFRSAAATPHAWATRHPRGPPPAI